MNPDGKSLGNNNESSALTGPLVWLLILASMAAFWGSVGLWVFGLLR